MKVAVFGPNLSMEGQNKGDVHVHAAGCGDCKHYGRGRRFGGEDSGWVFEAQSVREVVEEFYADQLDEGSSYGSCRAEVWVAPCVTLAE
jgi:hypothetical protein